MKWRIVLVPFALAIVIISRLLASFILIRFGEIWSSRLGHLIGNTECYLCEKPKKTFDIFHFQPITANRVVSDKYRQILHTWPIWFGSLVLVVNGLFKNHERHTAQSEQYDRDINNLWKKPHLHFTEEEKQQGRKLLKDLGIPSHARWVCLIVRDDEYLKEYGNFGYHGYRNADILDYIQAAQAIASTGRYVVRMGAKVEMPLPDLKNKRIIDYVSSPLRSDFGALYLGAYCEFCIGTSCGFMAIPQVFKRPCAVTDFVPIEYISTFCKDRVIWKHHFKDGKEMTFDEIIKSGAGQFMTAGEFENAGITLVNNSPEEITELVVEMLNGTNDDQTEFWEKFPRSVSPYNNKPLHGKMLARIGRKFLARLSHFSAAGREGAESSQAASV